MHWKIAKAGSDAVVAYAAEELCRCLRRMDEKLEISVLSYPAHDPKLNGMLWLGVCEEAVAAVESPDLDDLYMVDVEDGCGAIRGSNPRSVLIGVYDFLKEMGCAWVRPGNDGEIIPQYSIEKVSVHKKEQAANRHRGICIEGAVSYEHVRDMIDWMPKVGYNAYFNQFQNPVTFYNRWYAHLENPLLESRPLSSKEIEGLRDQSIKEVKKRGLLYHEAGHGWTCEPFGIPGETWDSGDYEVPAWSAEYLAEVNDVRALWRGIPLDTNLCYSNPKVREIMSEAVAQRCQENPDIDYVQVWLADGTNNHCECEGCRKMRPADWYIMLLNEIDEKLSSRGLRTRVVFLLYVDLLWEPEHVTLKNPDRFVLMFAPITRTYSASIADAATFDEKNLPPYERNQLQFPQSVDENLAWLFRWRKVFQGDGFDFDYHYMWDHFTDPGYFKMAETLFKDMQGLEKIGLHGMVSCQNQRVFFPNGLGMTAMAAALWNPKVDFDEVASKYFEDTYGEDGENVREYMRSLSEAFDPVYMRGDKPAVDPQAAMSLGTVAALVDARVDWIQQHVNDAALPAGIHASWNYLLYHRDYCKLVAEAFRCKAEGRFEDAWDALENAFVYARENEMKLHHVLDVFEMHVSLRKYMKKGMEV